MSNGAIEAEIQRRTAAQTAEHNRQIETMKETILQCQDVIIRQNETLTKLSGDPVCFGTILSIQSEPDPRLYERHDEVVISNPQSRYHNRAGIVVESPVNSTVTIKLLDIEGTVAGFPLREVRLSRKDNGTWAIVLVDGKNWEAKGISGMNLVVGQVVKVRADNKRIIGPGESIDFGPICNVSTVRLDGVEIIEKNEKRFIANPRNFDLLQDDRIVVDSSFSIIIKKLPKESGERYQVAVPEISWDEIGGLEDAKQQIRSSIELPYQHPELFSQYGIKKTRGILLFGPPGNGKTLLARAAASAMARIHGRQSADSGYLYIKSPEILDKWVGNTEKSIRDNFESGRKHFQEHGYPAIHVYDEADAIMPQRGVRRSSDIADTIVPMFLGEMDGVDVQATEANPIIWLLSNRIDAMDPAIIRAGRISRHIRVDRPDLDNALRILSIHAKGVPFAKEDRRSEVLAIAVNDLFSKSRLLYRVNKEFDFTLSDAMSGAMLSGLVEDAKEKALHRDLESGNFTGVTIDDFRSAVARVFHQQQGFNHAYDLADFAERHGLQPNQITVDRCYGAC